MLVDHASSGGREGRKAMRGWEVELCDGASNVPHLKVLSLDFIIVSLLLRHPGLHVAANPAVLLGDLVVKATEQRASHLASLHKAGGPAPQHVDALVMAIFHIYGVCLEGHPILLASAVLPSVDGPAVKLVDEVVTRHKVGDLHLGAHRRYGTSSCHVSRQRFRIELSRKPNMPCFDIPFPVSTCLEETRRHVRHEQQQTGSYRQCKS